ncbi:MAG TPA: hypothetical protein VH969_22245 [Actinophytocola sp.]|jgi:hypothetical protein|uniref:hypothetical protein n=1 Tax=Actinophytocola sp. TaxID=1872138 RepID=UPI002F95BB0E
MRFGKAVFSALAVVSMAVMGLVTASGSAAAAPPRTCPGTQIDSALLIDTLPGGQERTVGRVRLFYDNGRNCAQVVTSLTHLRLRVCLYVGRADTRTYCEAVGSGRNWVATGPKPANDKCVRAEGWNFLTASAVGHGEIPWGHCD